jgi:hypothetical protein
MTSWRAWRASWRAWTPSMGPDGQPTHTPDKTEPPKSQAMGPEGQSVRMQGLAFGNVGGRVRGDIVTTRTTVCSPTKSKSPHQLRHLVSSHQMEAGMRRSALATKDGNVRARQRPS